MDNHYPRLMKLSFEIKLVSTEALEGHFSYFLLLFVISYYLLVSTLLIISGHSKSIPSFTVNNSINNDI